MKKLVTIIIPVYNGSNYLKDAIESALAQTYKNIEVLVINDGSTDGGKTEEIAKSFGDKIRYICQENGGVASALNTGIKNAKGELISWLSHDDLYHPQKVEKQVEFYDKQKNKNVIVASNVELVDHELKHITYHKLSEKFENFPLSYLTFDVETGLNGCALLIPKVLFDRNGLFNLDLKVTQDYDMWSRFAINDKFVIYDEVLVKSRQHREQGSKTIKTVRHEVDNLHSRFISQITDKEFKAYFEDNLETMFNTIILFKDAMQSYNTAIEMFKKICLIYNTTHDKEIKDFFNNNFLMENSNELEFTNSQKKKILFYSNIWVKGGIERVLTTQFESLKDYYDIYFVATKYDKENGFKIPSYVHTIKLGEHIGSNLPVAILSICKLYEIDLFIGNQNLDINALKIYSLLNKNNIKSIASNHYSYYLPAELEHLKEIFEKKDNYYSDATAVVWTNSISAKIHSLKANNSYYIPNPNTYEVAESPTKNNNNIICVGRFDDPLKHIELTLTAFKEALNKNNKLKLFVIGKIDPKMKIYTGKNEEIKKVIKDLNIPEKNIEFVGQTNNVEKYYKEASLHLITSQTEGFGMVITEAACFGVPTISFDILGVKDIIKNKENGYLVDCYNTEQLSEKIVEYFSSTENMTNMKIAALKEVEKFSKEKISKEWKILIDSIINDKFKTNIEESIPASQLISIFDQTIKNINNNNEVMNKIIPKYNTFIGKLYSKVLHQYKTYGLKKTIIEITYYPIKICKKIINKIIRK